MNTEWEVTERYDLEGVRRMIVRLSDMEGISLFQMSRKAGLSHTTLWAILYRKNRREGNSVHRSTIKKLGDGLGYQVLFSSADGTVKFTKPLNLNADNHLSPDSDEVEQKYPPAEPINIEELRHLF